MRDIEIIIQSFNSSYPAVRIRQLKVLHPGADDDGLWFFERPGIDLEVKIESCTGMCPLLVETDENDTRMTVSSTDEAIETVARLLQLQPK